MFSNASFGAHSFDSSSDAREYVVVADYLHYTQELYVEGVQTVAVDLLSYTQSLQAPVLRRIKRVTNTVHYTQSLNKPVIKRVKHLGTLSYTQALNAPTIIRKHYEIPDSALQHVQTLHAPNLPKIATVDSALAFTQALQTSTTVRINHLENLSYKQSLYTPKTMYEVKLDSLGYVMTLLKPTVKYLTTAELLKYYFTVNTAKTLVVMPVDTIAYEMALYKPIINSYELLLEMHPYTMWKSYEVQREGKKLMVVQEVAHSINLMENNNE